MWIIGGFDGDDRKKDVWYSEDGITWIQATDNAGFLERDDHTSVVFDNKMWVIGGSDSGGKKDVWYSEDGITWIQATDDARFSKRSNHTSVVFNSKMWIVGGYVYGDNDYKNDVWHSELK